jgi:hypothetical protein
MGDQQKVSMERLTLNYVWKQKTTPVVLRRTGRGEKLRCDCRLLTTIGNDCGTAGERHRSRSAAITLIGSCRSLGSTISLIGRCIARQVCIIQPYREQEICVRAFPPAAPASPPETASSTHPTATLPAAAH